MLKNFDKWNEYKKAIDKNGRLVNFHEREVWWCSVGINIGSEQDSYSAEFRRPVIIVKKFTSTIFWAIPLTTRIKVEDNRITFKFNGVRSDALVLQMRALDCRRLVSKMGNLSQTEFNMILVSIIQSICTVKSMKTPSEGVSEAEANVVKIITSPRIYSIDDQRVLSNFFGERYPYRLVVSSKV